MTMKGTGMYAALGPPESVPPLVRAAVALAEELDFGYSVHPATGRLLSVLAAGVGEGLIGETGTGTGVGVAWMVSAAPSTTRIISVESDPDQAAAAAALFADHPNVTIVHGEANVLAAHGPFDLLVLDAPSSPGPLHWETLDPALQLTAGGVLVKDDVWPMTSWPPLAYDGSVDEQRIRWLEHPELFTSELTVADGYAVIVGRRRP